MFIAKVEWSLKESIVVNLLQLHETLLAALKMQTSEKDRGRRPRSLVGGGGSFEFTYDRHYGGIRDPGQPQEVEERKPRRPLSLYESLSKDMQQQASRTARTNSATSPSHENGDGEKAFAKLNTQEKADEVNKDKEKVITITLTY